MTKGAVALVLHAHLPYVRSAQPGSLEEDWFFQALIECYLPLLETLELEDSTKKLPVHKLIDDLTAISLGNTPPELLNMARDSSASLVSSDSLDVVTSE